jgi:putative transposase
MVEKRRNVDVGYIYHVLNRGVNRQTLFFTEKDFLAFEELLLETHTHIKLPILTYELMPNHWHFVVQPSSREQLSDFFQSLAGTHAKRFRSFHDSVGEGHVYQDRFKSFPIEEDGHLLGLCRYVERNALRAGLVHSAEEWRWSGLWRRLNGCDAFLTSDWQVEPLAKWLVRVNSALTISEEKAIQMCMRRGQPLGTPHWRRATAAELGLQHTLRRQGRPRTCDSPISV